MGGFTRRRVSASFAHRHPHATYPIARKVPKHQQPRASPRPLELCRRARGPARYVLVCLGASSSCNQPGVSELSESHVLLPLAPLPRARAIRATGTHHHHCPALPCPTPARRMNARLPRTFHHQTDGRQVSRCRRRRSRRTLSAVANGASGVQTSRGSNLRATQPSNFQAPHPRPSMPKRRASSAKVGARSTLFLRRRPLSPAGSCCRRRRRGAVHAPLTHKNRNLSYLISARILLCLPAVTPAINFQSILAQPPSAVRHAATAARWRAMRAQGCTVQSARRARHHACRWKGSPLGASGREPSYLRRARLPPISLHVLLRRATAPREFAIELASTHRPKPAPEHTASPKPNRASHPGRVISIIITRYHRHAGCPRDLRRESRHLSSCKRGRSGVMDGARRRTGQPSPHPRGNGGLGTFGEFLCVYSFSQLRA